MMKTDDELLRAWSDQGDRAALDELFERRREDVYRTAQRVLRNDADAHDATQATFLKALRRLGSLKEASRFPGWLRRICLNEAFEFRRSRGLQDRWVERTREEARRRNGRDDERTREDVQFLQRALDDLPEDYRLPIVLHHCDGLSYDEIARILDWPRGTVGTNIHRGLGRLRTTLSAATANSEDVLLAFLQLPIGNSDSALAQGEGTLSS